MIPPELVLFFLTRDLVFAQRIVVAGTVEVDDIAGLRAFQLRMIRAQGSWTYRGEPKMTVIVRRQRRFGQDAIGSHSLRPAQSQRTDKNRPENQTF